MGKPRIQWAEVLVTGTKITPRYEDHEIDDLFYQEDEIGEMRHTAFMVECGIEEDPPDGPDVPPVPWGEALAKLREEAALVAPAEPPARLPPLTKRPLQRELPSRSRSTTAIGRLAVELSPGQHRAGTGTGRPSLGSVLEEHRSPVAAASGSDAAKALVARPPTPLPPPPMAVPVAPPPSRAEPPRKALSSDGVKDMGLSLAFARIDRMAIQQREAEARDTPRRVPNRKLCKTRSGTVALSAKEVDRRVMALSLDGILNETKKGRPAPVVRKMVSSKSGTLHKARKKNSKKTGTDKKKDAKSKTSKKEKEKATTRASKTGKKTKVPMEITDDEGGSSPKARSSSRTSRSKSRDKDKKPKDSKAGRKSVTRQKSESSRTTTCVSDDDDEEFLQFLEDFASPSDEESVFSSDVSISTCYDSDSSFEHRMPLRERLAARAPRAPVRRRSPSKKKSSGKKAASSRSGSDTDETKAKKKKKKKKGAGSDYDSDRKDPEKKKKKKKRRESAS
ncbi:unnamed protein product [Pseudo-nitzschia multistriata]|uniref:Uncharacterized protein n=1 Tax=Pseudo-nitzschia multistriata TaxID=183589 RepID=A0A448ZCN7_9STRA|nr:unnamed protein product [Pseudo-nitzschia multistriata]